MSRRKTPPQPEIEDIYSDFLEPFAQPPSNVPVAQFEGVEWVDVPPAASQHYQRHVYKTRVLNARAYGMSDEVTRNAHHGLVWVQGDDGVCRWKHTNVPQELSAYRRYNMGAVASYLERARSAAQIEANNAPPRSAKRRNKLKLIDELGDAADRQLALLDHVGA
jgi:hypothetical protein